MSAELISFTEMLNVDWGGTEAYLPPIEELDSTGNEGLQPCVCVNSVCVHLPHRGQALL